MCGIIGYSGYRACLNVLLEGLEKLEYRGYDSAGVAVLAADGIQARKAQGRLSALEKLLETSPLPAADCGIGHTRWATHGAPSDRNSHPHCTPHLAVVHNGIVENYAALRTELEGQGVEFITETDTEVLAQLLESCYQRTGEPLAALQAMAARVEGSYGLAVLFCDRPGQVYLARRHSPLIVGYGEKECFVASDIPALLPYTKEYAVLDEGEMALLDHGRVEVYDAQGRPVEKEHLTAQLPAQAADKGSWPHFMLKEIFEQPQVLQDTLTAYVADDLPNLAPALPDKLLQNLGTVHLVGCGTAMHACMVGKTAIESLARVPAQVEVASEFRYRDPILLPGDLVVTVSQSGETSDTLAALQLAKERGIPTLAIVNVPGSSLARAADMVLYTQAGPEIAVASTKAYSVQLAVLYLIAIRMAWARKALPDARCRQLTRALCAIPAMQQPLLGKAEEMKMAAQALQNASDLFFVGRGMDYSLSLEGSLKLKEISYIHSEAYAAGELKHGTISLVTDGTPIVALATQSAVYEKTLSNVKEARARGARVLLLCSQNAPVPDALADEVVRLPQCEELLTPLLTILPLQLLAYYASVLRGCDVDRPRNLAKSVTVE